MSNLFDDVLRTLGTTLADPAFWVGLGVVFVFSQGRYSLMKADIEELDPPVYPRSFTTRFRYYLASFTYTGVYVAVYFGLIIIGSFPELQQYLVTFIGTIEGKDVGAPAWAAMAVTAVLPAVPVVARIDQRLRDFLDEFASIPLKARAIAEDVITGIRMNLERVGNDESNAGPSLGSIERDLRVFEEICDRIRRLKNSRRFRAAKAYFLFFAKNQAFQDRLEEQFEAIHNDVQEGLRDADFFHDHLEAMLKRIARYLVCAVLQVENNEYKARNVLAGELEIHAVRVVGWQFKTGQIIVGIVTVGLVTIIGSTLSAYLLLIETGSAIESSIIVYFIEIGVAWSVLAVPMFMLPLMFGAGTQLYLLDREQFMGALEWDDKLVAAILTFAGCYGLAVLPALLLAVLDANTEMVSTGSSENARVVIQQIFPWAVPPALVGTIFVLMSNLRLSDHRAINFVVDLVAHGVPAAVVSLIVVKLTYALGLAVRGVPEEYFLIAAPVTAGFIGGSLGALQCLISRQDIPSQSMAPATGARTWAE
ncbi:MAG: hypothetical protein GY791_06370 [Alphaproteobacteria bacterium]|nr:hypothetical protein [Alphaproteobacteria bacterium]